MYYITSHKLIKLYFPLNIREHFFTVRVTKHWLRLPGEIAKSPSLEIFKRFLHTVCMNSPRWSYLNRGLGPDDLQRSFQPQPFCDPAIGKVELKKPSKVLWQNMLS